MHEYWTYEVLDHNGTSLGIYPSVAKAARKAELRGGCTIRMKASDKEEVKAVRKNRNGVTDESFAEAERILSESLGRHFPEWSVTERVPSEGIVSARADYRNGLVLTARLQHKVNRVWVLKLRVFAPDRPSAVKEKSFHLPLKDVPARIAVFKAVLAEEAKAYGMRHPPSRKDEIEGSVHDFSVVLCDLFALMRKYGVDTLDDSPAPSMRQRLPVIGPDEMELLLSSQKGAQEVANWWNRCYLSRQREKWPYWGKYGICYGDALAIAFKLQSS